MKNPINRLEELNKEERFEALKAYLEQELSEYLGEEIETESLYDLEKKLVLSGYSGWTREGSSDGRAINLIGKKNEERIREKYQDFEPWKERQKWHEGLTFKLIEAGSRLRAEEYLNSLSIDLDDWRSLCIPMDYLLVDEKEKVTVYPDKSRLAQAITMLEEVREEERNFKGRKDPIKWREISFALDKYSELIEEVLRESEEWPDIIDEAKDKREIYKREEIPWI